MKNEPKSSGTRSDESMMWVVVLTCCFVMIRTAVVFLPAVA